jgi:membrane associated rhomboid family serine protease
MFNNLTPIVRHLLLINVVVYVSLVFLLPSWLYEDYFTLHKSNALNIRPEIEVSGTPRYILPGVERFFKGELPEGTDIVALMEQSAGNPEAAGIFNLFPAADRFHPVQIVTHFFTHSNNSLFHILFNMLFLAGLGPLTEMVLGSKRFLRFYLFCGVVSGLLLAYLDPSPIPVVGASGALSGVLVAFAMYFPNQKLMFMFIPVGIPARWFATGLAALSALLILLELRDPGVGGNISHFGHLSGMAGAVLYFFAEKYLPIRRN